MWNTTSSFKRSVTKRPTDQIVETFSFDLIHLMFPIVSKNLPTY